MPAEESPWLAVIGRSLALLAMHKQELGNADKGEQAAFLESLGLPRTDVAALLGTSPESVRVLMHRRKRNGGTKRGKKTTA
jgi:CRP-like cAMP-binding protein